MSRVSTFCAGAALLLGCAEGPAAPIEPDPDPIPSSFSLRLQLTAFGLSTPVYLTSPAGDPRLFVVERGGRILVIRNGAVLGRPFLDISSRVSSGGERGLFSVAFHPAYSTNRFLYVNFTDLNGNSRVERLTASAADPDIADPLSAKLILAVSQPFANHNGGLNLFGPDGRLYIGFGDGGSGGDPLGNAQNRATLLGKILRIDVDSGDPYAIPPSNPFVAQTGSRGEIWALGLRNPWRFAFDRVSSELYVADVGQNRLEEVNVAPAATGGINYGWNVMEGTSCFNAASCDRQPFRLPLLEYDHSGGACSVTGGLVYHGSAIPEIAGHYFYSDFCAGFLRSFRHVNGTAVEQRTWDVGPLAQVTSFGEDSQGELYVLSGSGTVHRIVRGQ